MTEYVNHQIIGISFFLHSDIPNMLCFTSLMVFVLGPFLSSLVLFLFVHQLIIEKYSIKKLDHINAIGLICSSKEKKNLCVLEFLGAA